ncbi:unnamed protein product, partial [Brassica oleracea]
FVLFCFFNDDVVSIFFSPSQKRETRETSQRIDSRLLLRGFRFELLIVIVRPLQALLLLDRFQQTLGIYFEELRRGCIHLLQ